MIRKELVYSFSGVYSSQLYSYIQQKKIGGYSYKAFALVFMNFDRFTLKYSGLCSNDLPKFLVEDWVYSNPEQKRDTTGHKATLIRQFAKHMQALGYTAYIIPSIPHCQSGDYIPYIFTNQELRKFFQAADSLPSFTNSPHRTATMSLLFRLLYGCGLRVSEALNLRIEDVDLERGILTVFCAKGNNSRLVPMAPDLAMKCRHYYNVVRSEHDSIEPFFAAPDGGFYCSSGIYYTFRRLLTSAGIPFKGKGAGPRVHDFRHTFAVHCLKKWAQENRDISTALPYLSTYLGHKSFYGTQRYLRLTADIFPEITQRLETLYGDLIPKEAPIDERD